MEDVFTAGPGAMTSGPVVLGETVTGVVEGVMVEGVAELVTDGIDDEV